MMRSVLRIGLLAGGIIAPTLAGQPAGATDLPPAIPTKAPPPPSIWNWTGTYVGLNLGYGSGSWKSGGSIGGQAADPSPNVSGVFGRTLGGTAVQSPLDFCSVALEQAGVALVPGEAFGSKHHVRLSYATSAELIEKGMDRLAKLLN